MITKLQAARLATSSGTDVVIASGRRAGRTAAPRGGRALGTFFPATANRLESRKRWILSGLSIRGSLVVDDGAEQALRERNTSLLPAGVKEVCGSFERGETIEVVTTSGKRLAQRYRELRVGGDRPDQRGKVEPRSCRCWATTMEPRRCTGIIWWSRNGWR